MDAETLSEVLRTGSGLFLSCRRGTVATSFVAAICMMFVGMYQVGLIRHLPEPPFRLFNADKVDAAPEAYRRMSLPMPDAFLGLISYALTAALAALGTADRSLRWWWLPLLLAAKVLTDAVQAGRLTWEQWALHRQFCFWCLLAAAVTWVAVPLALPEPWAVLKRIFDST